MTYTELTNAIDKYIKDLKLSKDKINRYIRNIIIWAILIFVFHHIKFLFILSIIFDCINVFNLIVEIPRYKSLKRNLNLLKDYLKNNRYTNEYTNYNSYRTRYSDILNDYFKDFFEERQRQQRQQNINKKVNIINEYQKALKLFGLSDENNENDFKKKYRELANKWHPDKFSTDTIENQEIAHRNFVKLNNAYETIKNYKKFN